MVSWTRTALALLINVPHAKHQVERALPECARIAAHHVHGWMVLQKHWTRAAIKHAKGLSMAAKKMIEITVDGLHVAMHHLSVWLSPLQAEATVAMAVPGCHTARVLRADCITPAQADPPSPRVEDAPLWLLPVKPTAPDHKATIPCTITEYVLQQPATLPAPTSYRPKYCWPIPRRRHWIFLSMLLLLNVVAQFPPI